MTADEGGFAGDGLRRGVAPITRWRDLEGRAELVERVDEHDRVLGVVERREAVSRGWPHRVAATVCRDPDGRYLVHRRAEGLARFPGMYECVAGGAVEVGETYERAAARELAEEFGVSLTPRRVVTYLSRTGLSPYWLALHEALVTGPLIPDPAEIAWYGWLTGAELRELTHRTDFVPDGREAFERYGAAVAVSTSVAVSASVPEPASAPAAVHVPGAGQAGRTTP
jgi:8-oxo-dGTP pyrophosphatase MutT (NUDIX family)